VKVICAILRKNCLLIPDVAGKLGYPEDAFPSSSRRMHNKNEICTEFT
jgi:hypothetical protein